MKVQIEDIETAFLHRMWQPRPADGHKGTFGHALLVVGSKGMAGAAILSAEACLRSGVGKLSIFTAEENRGILQIAVPEAIVISANALHQPFAAVGVGPGLGMNYGALRHCLQKVEAPLAIDADALNMLASLPYLQEHLPPKSILTPHPKEAERLIGSSAVADVAEWARAHGVIVVLKGHPTHVCTPEGKVFRLLVGNSGMATAGSGDVLTGLTTGLLAQGYPPQEAALLGVWLHGAAGDSAADEMGENCMLARDIVRHLPEGIKRLKG